MAVVNGTAAIEEDPSRTFSYINAVDSAPATNGKVAHNASDGVLTAPQSKDGANEEMASFNDLWRYASKRDRALFWVAATCSLVQGAGMPAWCVLFGKLYTQMVTATLCSSLSLHYLINVFGHACTYPLCFQLNS